MYLLIFAIFIFIFIILKIKSPGIKGKAGEFRVAEKLKPLDCENYKILNDIMLKNKSGRTSQIDHIVVSLFGIFVIETKNYKGWIFGNEKSENWLQVIYKKKHLFRNPVKQNLSHIYTLKDILCEFPNACYFPIVVFTGSAELKEIKSSVPVLYASELTATIKRLSASQCLSLDEVDKIVRILETQNIEDGKRKKEHIQNIKNSVSEAQLKKEKLICPKCNSELKLRQGKYGTFYGCTNYPKCRFTMKR